MRFRRVFCSCLFSCFAIVLARPALRAQAPAPASSSSPPISPSTSKQIRRPTPAADSKLDSGTVSAGVYRNPGFGFACKIPAGWVLRTEEMNVREGQSTDGDKTAADSSKAGRVLLAAFSRPPEARAEDVNGSILIAAESASAYPGLKDAAQYFGPVTEGAKAQGFEVVEEPYEFSVGAKTMVRGDFRSEERRVGKEC